MVTGAWGPLTLLQGMADASTPQDVPTHPTQWTLRHCPVSLDDCLRAPALLQGPFDLRLSCKQPPPPAVLTPVAGELVR